MLIKSPENPVIFDLELTVNGENIQRRTYTHTRLLDFLRDDLRLTGCKEVCAEGECGACTVLMDGIAVNSCLILAVETHGSNIITIEGLEQDGRLAPLQQAFIDHHSVQCGYCIPGMIMTGQQILKENPQADRSEIKEDLSGNICRCTGYQKIIDAIEASGKRS